jgi:hypothetical protein
MFLTTSFLICLCTKDLKKEDISDTVKPDSILYNDFKPDMAVKFSFDTSYDNHGNKIIKGEFNYKIDINMDSIFDFIIVGKEWGINGTQLDDSVFIEGLNGCAYIGYRHPSQDPCCPCNAQCMVQDEIIDKNLKDGWIQSATIHYTKGGTGCSWRYRPAEKTCLAIWLPINNEIFYGWIDAWIPGWTSIGDTYVIDKFVIDDFAINLRNEKSIRAGQKL